MMPLVAVLALVFVAGYTTQRGNICALVAVQELVLLAHRFVDFLLCAACALVPVAIAEAFGVDMLARYPGLPLSGAAAVGGVIYAVGAFINGKCAFGTIARLGAGDVPRLATLGAFVLGAMLALPQVRLGAAVASPVLALPAPVEVALAVGAALGLFALLRFVLRDAREPRFWSPAAAMSLIGAINGLLIVMAQSWPYTALLIDMAGGRATELVRRGAMAIAFVLGAGAGAVTVGIFRLHLGSARDWLRASVGGFAMGAGATLVPGGNDRMLLVGLPLLLANLVLAYATMNATLILLVRLAAARRLEPAEALAG